MLRHQSLIDKLSLAEKASLLSGANFWNTKAIDRLGIPSIMLTDGPHGLRKQGGKADHLGLNKSIPATCFPTAATLANSWDVALVKEVGEYIGREAAAEEVSVLLGPGLNIVRNPLGGRTFEYYSEDPFIAGRLAASMVEGIQSTGIAASPKHFAVNSQEHLRMSMNEVVDERSLREIYLEGFRHVVQESKPKTIMSAYNKVNGTYANENKYIIHDILKKEWGFDGVVVTDWGGENDRVAGLKVGNQLEMPSSNGITDHDIVRAVKHGELKESVVDSAADDMLELIFSTTQALQTPQAINPRRHHKKAIEAAERSIVLLKNEENILPLRSKTRVAIIGDFAKKARYQGAGSSLVNPTQLDAPLDALQKSSLDIIGYAQGFKRAGGKSQRLRHQALRLAESAEVVLLFVGLDESLESEGSDRQDMRISQAQLKLVDSLTKHHQKVVVVLVGGAPIEMPFIDTVPAVIHGFLGGQGGGQAMADILTGKTNPSGKLAVTYPLSYSDVPSSSYFPGKETVSEHREGIYVGYRYYDTKNIPVLFPFGFGLSYTQFAYSSLQVKGSTVSWTIKNIGSVEGEEIGQVYIRPINPKVFKANKELKGFTKIKLQPGESRKVSVELDDHAFSYYNVSVGRWVIEPGDYEIQVAASIQDVRLSTTIAQKGEIVVNPYRKGNFSTYRSAEVAGATRADFQELIGSHYKIPAVRWDRKKALTLDDTIHQLQYKNLLGRASYGLLGVIRRFLYLIGQPNTANNLAFVSSLTFGKIERFTGGKISKRSIQRYLDRINK